MAAHRTKVCVCRAVEMESVEPKRGPGWLVAMVLGAGYRGFPEEEEGLEICHRWLGKRVALA